jgi:hypothetical protein
MGLLIDPSKLSKFTNKRLLKIDLFNQKIEQVSGGDVFEV